MIAKGDYIIGVGNTSTIAQDFDFVLTTLNKQIETRLKHTLFRGTKKQLIGGDMLEPGDMTVTIKVVEDGKPDRELKCHG
jgi:hypothetical protein